MSATLCLTARGESLAAFDERCIPASGVAPPSNTPGILSRRALPAGRLARLGATPDVHHGLFRAFTLPVERDISAAPNSWRGPRFRITRTREGTMRQVLFAISPAVVTLRRTLATLFLVLLVASPALAQTGQINGVITDNTGGVVPGATVKAVEVATGLSRDTVTDADGRYTFTSLRPTTYDITAELQGFRTSQRKGLLLQANENLTVNFAIEVGALSETVTVSGESPTVDVTSSAISEVVESKRIVELPLNGRDAAKLSTLVAGMVLTAVDQESGKTIPGALRLSTNGTEARQVSFRLDGTSHTDPYFQQNQPFPFPDALQEFSIQTSNYSAAQGNSAGAVVNAVTRSGTNDFHGGGFDIVRDGRWNAKNYFATTPDFLKRKQYGGYIGGPVKHNHTFFFTGWQRTNLTNVGTTKTATIPTIDQRNGIFTTAIKDPATCDAAGQNCQNFANNTIPLSRFDPASVQVLKLMPQVGGNGVLQI